jgi:hypothetical protein
MSSTLARLHSTIPIEYRISGCLPNPGGFLQTALSAVTRPPDSRARSRRVTTDNAHSVEATIYGNCLKCALRFSEVFLTTRLQKDVIVDRERLCASGRCPGRNQPTKLVSTGCPGPSRGRLYWKGTPVGRHWKRNLVVTFPSVEGLLRRWPSCCGREARFAPIQFVLNQENVFGSEAETSRPHFAEVTSFPMRFHDAAFGVQDYALHNVRDLMGQGIAQQVLDAACGYLLHSFEEHDYVSPLVGQRIG